MKKEAKFVFSPADALTLCSLKVNINHKENPFGIWSFQKVISPQIQTIK
ncbi:hypothetical protein [Angelakisella massiliensis]|nr:hypothetical protein [Angelakisella massiliensis]